jgi:hypothetical protein
MTDRSQPGVTFWATVIVVAALIAYPLSLGPAAWLAEHDWLTGRTLELAEKFYYPIIWLDENGPEPVSDAIDWYADLWTGPP